MQDIREFIAMYYNVHHGKGKQHTFKAFKGILSKQANCNTMQIFYERGNVKIYIDPDLIQKTVLDIKPRCHKANQDGLTSLIIR